MINLMWIVLECLEDNILILKSQPRFRSEKHNISTDEVNKIVLSPNNNKRIQSVCSIKIYGCRTSNEIIDQNNTEYNTRH